ncbi:MAG: FtsH protease activity modulator HflK [Rickettsiales bacterium]|nr:FtsH protease activity modulator HflK [Rickettsiales bacterium]
MSGNNKGPWGQRPNRDKDTNNPWGDRKKNRASNSGSDDFDELFEKINEFFSKLSGGGNKNGGGNRNGSDNGVGAFKMLVFYLALGLLVVWLASGFYRVQPEEQAVVLRFGEWNRTQTDSGLGYHLPWPIETVSKPNVTFQRRIEIGFRGDLSRRGQRASYVGIQDVPKESLMVTGDENIIDIDFVVVWSIKDAKSYLFNIRDPEGTLKKVAESMMREVIGQTDIQPALTQARTQIESRTKQLIQETLNSYDAGVAIETVQLQKVDPPGQVVDAFNEVQRARADRERLRNEAEAYRNDIIPRARGQAEQLIQEAEAYREKVVNQATGDASRFTSVLKSYSQAKEVTAKRMYLETLEKIYGNVDKVIVDDQIGGSGLVPFLPVNDVTKNSKKK